MQNLLLNIAGKFPFKYQQKPVRQRSEQTRETLVDKKCEVMETRMQPVCVIFYQDVPGKEVVW